MINFDAVAFSEHRSEEVISFFWRSVYITNVQYQNMNIYFTKGAKFCWKHYFLETTKEQNTF